jgi:hypothetical protein
MAVIIILGALILLLAFSHGGSSAVCGTHYEQYESTAQGCDHINGCQCLHRAYLGLGACDSCSCTRQVSNC